MKPENQRKFEKLIMEIVNDEHWLMLEKKTNNQNTISNLKKENRELKRHKSMYDGLLKEATELRKMLGTLCDKWVLKYEQDQESYWDENGWIAVVREYYSYDWEILYANEEQYDM